MKAQKLREMRKALQGKYAWPGGYPLMAIMSDGGEMCPDCAVKEWRNIYQAMTQQGWRHSGWAIEGVDVNWEDPECFCCHCNKRIESAYAEDEAEDDSPYAITPGGRRRAREPIL